jgi:hypothetical protein
MSIALGKENFNSDNDMPKLNLLPEGIQDMPELFKFKVSAFVSADKNSELLARVFTLLGDAAIVEEKLDRVGLAEVRF